MRKLNFVSIYVSHHSEKYIKKFYTIHKAELGDKVYLVNSSSNDINSDEFSELVVLNLGKNVGFAVSNNLALSVVQEDVDFYMLINPDILLPSGWLVDVVSAISEVGYNDVGIFTVPLLGYDFKSDKPTGYIDSVGVYPTWYGRWYDCMSGMLSLKYVFDVKPYELPAVCGAMMIVRADVIKSLQIKDGFVFNESYFMYKEDIELSIRVRRLGMKILMLPSAPAYHCRGWDGCRDSPYWKRLLSAKNELTMHKKYRWRFVPYSVLKYMYVRFFEKK